MPITGPVVAQRPLPRDVLDVCDRDLLSGRRGRLPRELERLERGAGVAAGTARDLGGDVGRHSSVEGRRAALEHLPELLEREWLELDHGAP